MEPTELILLEGTVSAAPFTAPDMRYSKMAFSPTGIRRSTISALNWGP